ncbi:MAG TPA: hypothetical protein VFC67_20910 [Prolixibacteraceae bacterium]|nr:hypothetical protein [Prolixibacteraceae bacterium]
MKNFFKTFKEEMVFIPLLIIAFFGINWFFSSWFPDSAFFDFYSQLETIAFRVLSFVLVLAIAWFGLRIAFPQMFHYLVDDFYQDFKNFDNETKRKYAVRFFLVFVISCALVSRGTGSEKPEVRNQLLKALETQLNVRETLPNRGPMVDKYLQSVGISFPAPWCAAFVSYNLQQFKILNPNSAWSPDYAKKENVIWTNKKKTWKPLPCDVVTYYYANLKRVGHVGFYLGTDKSGYFITQEGNTNSVGSREGDGVYKKKREPNKVYAISRYIK